MPDEIQLSMRMGLYVHDADQMRDAAYERLQEAWSQDEEFPYGSAKDVPLDVAVNSLLANALPVDLPGCRRGQLIVESADSDQEESGDDADEDADEAAPDEDRDAATGSGTDDAATGSGTDDAATGSDTDEDPDAATGDDHR